MGAIAVSDSQYKEYAKRLWFHIQKANSYSELLKLKPSVVHIQKHMNQKRLFMICSIVQDYTHKLEKYSHA